MSSDKQTLEAAVYSCLLFARARHGDRGHVYFLNLSQIFLESGGGGGDALIDSEPARPPCKCLKAFQLTRDRARAFVR